MCLACTRMCSIHDPPPTLCTRMKRRSVICAYGSWYCSCFLCFFVFVSGNWGWKALHKTGKLSITELNLHCTFGFYRVSLSYSHWPWTHSVVYLDVNKWPYFIESFGFFWLWKDLKKHVKLGMVVHTFSLSTQERKYQMGYSAIFIITFF